MSQCKYPGCGVEVKPPNVFCSWMCEVDFQKLPPSNESILLGHPGPSLLTGPTPLPIEVVSVEGSKLRKLLSERKRKKP